MKSISYKQSRKNSARRGRKAKVRRARARGGRAGSKPVFGPGRIHLEIGDRIGAMSFGGIGVMRRLVSRLGLVREIDRRLHLLKRHLPYRESDHVLNIAYNILCGSTRLEDLNGLRNNVPYLDALDAKAARGKIGALVNSFALQAVPQSGRGSAGRSTWWRRMSSGCACAASKDATTIRDAPRTVP